jgi:hypothetical protein
MTIEPGEKVSVFALRCQQAGKLKCLSKPTAQQYAKDHGSRLPSKKSALIVGIPGNPQAESEEGKPRCEVLFWAHGWYIAG